MPSLPKRKKAPRPPAAAKLLQAGLDALGEGFALFDPIHILVSCNKQFAVLSGYPTRLCRRGATLGALLRFAVERGDFGAGDTTALVTARLEHIVAGDGNIESGDTTRPGVVIRHRRLAKGYVLLTCSDKRDVRAAEDAMRATEERFALVTAAATEGYYDWDVVSDQLYVSPQLNLMFGFEAGYLKSRTWNDRIVTDDYGTYRRALLDHFKQLTARLQCEYRIRLASGEVRWVADRATAVRGADGRAIRLVGAVSDITAEKVLAAALKDSEVRYAHALAAIGEGLYEWDIVNDKTFYSPGVYREMDIPERELQTPQDWIRRIHPEDLPRFREATREHLRGLTPRFESEVRYRASDGSWRWARQHGLVVRDAEGRATRLIGSTGDITQSKQLAEALVQAEARLQAAVEAASEGFVVWDENDRLVICNSVYRHFFRGAEHLVSPGNTFETIIRAGYDRGMFPDAGSDFDAWFDRLQAGRHSHSGHREQHVFDGQWLLISDRALSGGGVVSVYADITKNKQRELELADAVTRLGSTRDELTRARTQLIEAIESISEGFVLFDANDRLILHNNRFREFYAPIAHVIREGVSFREMLTETVRGGLLTTIDRPPEEWLEWRLSLHRNQTTPLELKLSDGRWLSISERRTLEGGVVGIYADITTLKEREEELSQTVASLAVARDSAEAALEQQTATADILKVIASSPTDVQPVLDAVVTAAVRFCGAEDATMGLRDGESWRSAAHAGPIQAVTGERFPLTRESLMSRAIVDGETQHVRDVNALDPAEFAIGRQLHRRLEVQAALVAPLLREGVAIGCINLRKREPGAFTPQQIELLETLAAQAVIAIENVRLFTELREALEQQTATSEILRAISQSPTDVQPVLDVVVNAARRFCGASDALIMLRDGTESVVAAHEGPIPAALGLRRLISRSSITGRSVVDASTVHVGDITMLDEGEFAEAISMSREFNWRAAVAVPMMREGVAVGSILLRKPEQGDFKPRQIELLESFAAQAVIAIENVRLFTELRESLEQQTASAEILQVISQSPTNVEPVLKAVVGAARRFCGADDAMVVLREGTEQLLATHEGSLLSLVGTRFPLDRSSATGRATIDGKTFHVPDVASLDPAKHALTIDLTRRTGVRALLAAPMLCEGHAIGCVLLRRPTSGAFTPRQIELLEAFAAQAVIAIQNVRLFTELRDSLERLKAAQANLIQSEKMASLGQLTAGIAHEIKNPLNFVNNFAGLSVELLGELKEIAEPALAGMSEGARADFGETIELITGNLDKIAVHGKRADGIVKSMLSHSRGGTGDWQESNINALVEEALNLAYHGARAQDKEFNVTLERDLAPGTQPIELVPQDVTRVFLNLFGNGFYAANKRRLAGSDTGYRPTLKVSTRDLGEAVEVKVRDNGIGILPEVRAKLFQPFFTTKPTGEGTGLGLSISYDIVTQQHGGTIGVDSEPGSFTEFTVRLPRGQRAARSRGT